MNSVGSGWQHLWCAMAVGGAVLASGCGNDESSGPTAGMGQVEIFSWWTKGGEKQALDALIELYESGYPDSEIVNLAQDTGDEAKAILQQLMVNGQPPDSFQVIGGQALIQTWVLYNGVDDVDTKVEPLDALYLSEGFGSVFPQPLIDAVSYGGHIYSVPANIHRGNAMFYGTALLAEHGLRPPTTWAEFYAAADALRSAGIPALAVGYKEPWPLAILFQDILLGMTSGPYFTDFYSGRGDPGDATLRAALEQFVTMLSYANADGADQTWDTAADMVLTGRAAMTVMGDWTTGYLVSNGWAAGQDFGEVASPGTDGEFIIISDTFAVPKSAAAQANAMNFLRIVGSPAGQNAFNEIKGSIPARRDITDTSGYDWVTQQTIATFSDPTTEFVLDREILAPPPFASAMQDALKQLAIDHNVDVCVFSITNSYANTTW